MPKKIKSAPPILMPIPAAQGLRWRDDDAQLARIRTSVRAHADGASAAHWSAFDQRLRRHLPTLHEELAALYGHRADFEAFLCRLLAQAFDAWRSRDSSLKALDRNRRSVLEPAEAPPAP